MTLQYVHKFLDFLKLQNNYEKFITEATQTVATLGSSRSLGFRQLLRKLEVKSNIDDN